jgi:hypothetical protein
LILCDMDGVLATGPGTDTACGQPIYRTFVKVPDELGRIRAAGIPIHVVTAKVEAEASQVLQAVGLDGHVASVVGADRLFWPSVWAGVRKGRLPRSVSKSLCRRLLQQDQAERVVMIENYHPHLCEMLAAGAIDLGILVPPISMDGGRISAWFDIDLALRVAREFVIGTLDPAELSGGNCALYRWDGEDLHQVDLSYLSVITEGCGYLLRLPGLSVEDSAGSAPAVEDLQTGNVLLSGRRSLVSTVRVGRRFLRDMVRRLLT